MANLSTIRQRLSPWVGRNGSVRYYVRDVDKLIGSDLWREGEKVGHYNFLNDSKLAKVWFDDSGRIHVEHVSNPLAAEAIARLVDRHFSVSLVTVPEGPIELDWSETTDALPHEMRDQTYLFDYKGRIYYVNVTVYCWERDHNAAVLSRDGTFVFESDSSDLWELVVELYKDGRISKKGGVPDMFRSLSSWDSVRPEPTGTEYSRNLSPDDPERARVEGRGVEHKKKPEPERRAEPESRLVLHRLTDEEIEQMSREAAAETTHPKTGWTKAEFVDVARRAGVPEEQLAVLSRMKLDEIRSTCLIYDGTDITGNEYNSMQQRHTKFYRLDIEYIKSLRNRSRPSSKHSMRGYSVDYYAFGDKPVVLPLVAIDEKCAAVLIALIAYELDSDL